MEIREISVSELKRMKTEDATGFILIDVREKIEYDMANIGGKLIPKGTVDQFVEEFESEEKPVIVHCRSGKRSSDVIYYLQEKYGLKNLYNLRGGIMAYAQEIDPSLNVL
jgi:adenylyltransferase/sulfurtransferase